MERGRKALRETQPVKKKNKKNKAKQSIESSQVLGQAGAYPYLPYYDLRLSQHIAYNHNR